MYYVGYEITLENRILLQRVCTVEDNSVR